MGRAAEQYIWLVYPEFRKLRVPYRYNGFSFLDATLPAPSSGRFLGKSGLGPYFLVSTNVDTIQTAPGWNAMRYDGKSVAASLDPRCAMPPQATITTTEIRGGLRPMRQRANQQSEEMQPTAA